MEPSTLPPSAPAAAPEKAQHLRLVITVPVAIVLFLLIYGLVSYSSFSAHWDELTRLGAGAIVGQIWRVHLTTMIVLVVGAAIMGVFVTNMILRPIRELAEATRQVARGNLTRHATASAGSPELEALSDSFNEMVDTLRQSIEERNQRLMASLPVGVLMTDTAGRILAVNPRAATMLGVDPAALIDQPVEALTREATHLPPGLVPLLEAGLNGPASLEGVELSGPDGQIHCIVTASALGESGESPGGVLFSLRDAAGMHQLSSHLEHTDQLAMLGAFSLGLAHELRNPLGAIKGLSQLLQVEREMPLRAGPYLTRIDREVDRLDAFVGKILDLGGQHVIGAKPTDLCDVMAQAERAAGDHDTTVASGVHIERAFEPVPPILLESERIVQAVARLIENAMQWTPEHGRIALRVGPGAEGQGRIEVFNTGSAIKAELAEKIFDPFFSLRDGATGLGLTLARQIALQNGGALRLESSPEGISFIMTFGSERRAEYLPAMHENVAPSSSEELSA